MCVEGLGVDHKPRENGIIVKTCQSLCLVQLKATRFVKETFRLVFLWSTDPFSRQCHIPCRTGLLRGQNHAWYDDWRSQGSVLLLAGIFPGMWLCLGFELFSRLFSDPSPADDYQVKLPLLSPSLLCLHSDLHGVASHLHLQPSSTPTEVPHVLMSAPALSFQIELTPVPLFLLISPFSLWCH